MTFLIFSSADLAGLACLAGLGWLTGMAWRWGGKEPWPVLLCGLSMNYLGTIWELSRILPDGPACPAWPNMALLARLAWLAGLAGLAWLACLPGPGWPRPNGLQTCLPFVVLARNWF